MQLPIPCQSAGHVVRVPPTACRTSALPRHKPSLAVACRGNNSRGLRSTENHVLDHEQSQAQLEKGHCAINVHLQARIGAPAAGTVTRRLVLLRPRSGMRGRRPPDHRCNSKATILCGSPRRHRTRRVSHRLASDAPRVLDRTTNPARERLTERGRAQGTPHRELRQSRYGKRARPVARSALNSLVLRCLGLRRAFSVTGRRGHLVGDRSSCHASSRAEGRPPTRTALRTAKD